MTQRLKYIYLIASTLEDTKNIANYLEKKSSKLHNTRERLLKKKSTDVSNISHVMIWVKYASIIKQKKLFVCGQ